jgi:hypothetical protein
MMCLSVSVSRNSDVQEALSNNSCYYDTDTDTDTDTVGCFRPIVLKVKYNGKPMALLRPLLIQPS